MSITTNAKKQRAAIVVFSANEIKRLEEGDHSPSPMVHFDSTKLSTRHLQLNFAPAAVL